MASFSTRSSKHILLEDIEDEIWTSLERTIIYFYKSSLVTFVLNLVWLLGTVYILVIKVCREYTKDR